MRIQLANELRFRLGLDMVCERRKKDSSEKSVGEFRLGQLAKGMIEG